MVVNNHADGFNKIYFYTSPNGTFFESENNGNPIIRNATTGWDKELYKSTFIYQNGVYKIWYGGINAHWYGVWSIGYTEYPSPNATTPVTSFTIDHTLLRIPQAVVVNDTSNNTPTSWNWSWGDGTANGTTNNATHEYTKRGKWNIILTATNAGGSNTSAAVAVRVVGYETYW
jgi:PKD repeat protein